MEYLIKTHKGINFTLTDAPNLEQFVAQLNNRALLTVALSNMVMNKNNIKLVTPKVQPQDDEVNVHKLYTADGETINVTIEGYNADVISASFNNPSNDFVLVGTTIVNKHNIDLLK